MGAPRYLNVCLMSMICSVAVFAVTNSEPYVALSTVACSLEYQSTGTKGRHPIRGLPVAKQWFKLALLPHQVVLAYHQEEVPGDTIYRVCPVKILLW